MHAARTQQKFLFATWDQGRFPTWDQRRFPTWDKRRFPTRDQRIWKRRLAEKMRTTLWPFFWCLYTAGLGMFHLPRQSDANVEHATCTIANKDTVRCQAVKCIEVSWCIRWLGHALPFRRRSLYKVYKTQIAFLPLNNSVTVKAKISDLQRTRGCWNVQKGRGCASFGLLQWWFILLESFKLTNPTRHGSVTSQATRIGNEVESR